VFCGGLDAAKTIPQHASTQILKGRIIGSPFHGALIFCNFTSSMERLITAQLGLGGDFCNQAISLIEGF
jgi:hypothetical protein